MTSGHKTFFHTILEEWLNIFARCVPGNLKYHPIAPTEILNLKRGQSRRRKRVIKLFTESTGTNLLYVLSLQLTIYKLLLFSSDCIQHLLLSCGPALMVSSIDLLHQRGLILASPLMYSMISLKI